MRAALTIASVALVSLLLSGCVPPQPVETPLPEASVTPIFATDEEALAAATAAYAAYQKVIDEALASYSTAELSGVATGAALEAAIESVASFKAEEKRLVGSSSVETISPVQFGQFTNSNSIDPAQIYGCLDISKTDVVNPAGESIVDRTGTSRIAMLVSLQWDSESASALVSEAEVWDGNDFCA
jgi:hypothetical protein